MPADMSITEQSFSKKVFQKLTKAAVDVMLRPQVFWEDKSLRNQLKGKRAIFLCNHTDHYDGIFAGAVLEKYQPYALVKNTWYDKPKTGKLIQMSRSIPIDLEAMDASWYQTAEELLNQDGSMLIFPEGAIAREGKMLAFQPGAALLAAKTGAPLIPAAIYGEYSFSPKKRQVMLIGNPIYCQCPEDMRPSKYARMMTERAEKEVRRLYGALEKKYGKLPVYFEDSFTD